MSVTTQSTTLATVPSGTAIAADQVGTANAPATGDRLQYVKLDVGAAGASSPVTAATPLPVSIAAALSTNATLSAETTKVIGTVNVAASQTIAATQATAANLNATVSLAAAQTLAAVTTVSTVTNLSQLAGTAPVMKASGTAPATTDVALVVGVSPNSPVYHRSSDLVVTTLSTSATTVTLTLPAVAAAFHYITRIEILRVSTAAVTGSAVLAYTSTNLPGSWARSAGNAIAIGATVKDVDEVLASPLKSSVLNTATTIVAPSGGTGVQVRITVYYYTAP